MDGGFCDTHSVRWMEHPLEKVIWVDDCGGQVSLNSSTLHRELLTCGRSTGTQNHSLISLSLKQQLLHVRLELMRGVGLWHHVAETPHFSGFIFKVRVIINLNQQQRGNESLICLS